MAAVARPEARSWTTPAGVGAGVAAAAALVAAVDPSKRGLLPCPLHVMTGWWCPFCGSTRAAHQLLTLHPVGALGFNAIFTVAVPFLVAAWAWWMAAALGWVRAPAIRVPRSAKVAAVVVVVVFGVLRNIHGWPADLLAP